MIPPENRSGNRLGDEHDARIITMLPARLADAAARISVLSIRQIEVISLLAEGSGNRFIADQMGISEATVKQYVTVILVKLQLDSRLQAGLVGFASKAAGLLPTEHFRNRISA